MKMIVQRTQISAAEPFNLSEIKEFLWITTNDTDASLKKMAWEAAAEVESFAQIALLRQTIRVTILNGTLSDGMSLPVGPMQDAGSVALWLDGAPSTAFEAVTGNRPYLSWSDALCGASYRRVEVEYEAGFGDDASGIPQDLAQAVIDQAYQVYDGRSIDEVKSRRRSMQLARVAARYRGVAM